MKKYDCWLIIFVVIGLTFQSCEVQNDNEVPNDIAVQNFVWKGLNLYYLWQADVPNLADSRFNNQSDLNQFLFGYSDPKNLFQNLLNKPKSIFPNPGEAIDRFSVITDDYYELEGILAGTTKNNGADFALYYKDDTQTAVFGVVRYILPNSDAASKNVIRGNIFYAIDGVALNKNNYNALLSPDTYTLNFADYDNGNITPNGQSISLTKTIISENPVLISNVINSGSHRIGYLMYNGFYPNYESQLNAAVGNLKAQNITELVLDLRYNSGGSIATATRLASMITGQFPNQIFGKEQWNAKLEDYYSANNPSTLYNLFTTRLGNNEAISSLNLTKIYILTTKSTASASELIINGLKPYITVIQIGDVTVGKNVGSITLYDSPSFSKEDISTKHRYAMQPLVLKIVNKVGFGDYTNGLLPDIVLKENFGNLGVLGNTDEPLLNQAINSIIGSGRSIPSNRMKNFKTLQDTRIITRLKSEMYIDEIPSGMPSN
ncbi:S41 family peptidase [Flavobacterium sp.]|uniref:S41 family peptidase n=1 Tax=Flavobacterium sp. TaxID=239 RepID=UPI00286A5C55|nr:S41 family peptidase [Flavobacterium sp.]